MAVGCAVRTKASFYYYEWTRKGKPSEFCCTYLLLPTIRAEHTSTPLDSHQGQPPAGICLWRRSISFVWSLWPYLLENAGQTAIEMFDILSGIVQLKRYAMI